jgi:hypothetical protein
MLRSVQTNGKEGTYLAHDALIVIVLRVKRRVVLSVPRGIGTPNPPPLAVATCPTWALYAHEKKSEKSKLHPRILAQLLPTASHGTASVAPDDSTPTDPVTPWGGWRGTGPPSCSDEGCIHGPHTSGRPGLVAVAAPGVFICIHLNTQRIRAHTIMHATISLDQVLA